MSGQRQTYNLIIPSLPDQIQAVEEKAEELATLAGFNEDDRDSLAIAITEMVANAIYHGNRGDASKKVHVRFVIDGEKLSIFIQDEGGGFNPKSLADPLKPENLLKDSGRGIFIVRTLMDDVRFKFSKTGTTVILVKNRG